MIAFAPGTPPLNPAPVRDPIDVPNKQFKFKDSQSWQTFFNLLYSAVIYLLSGPVLLSGLLANRPAATILPENTRYWGTNTMVEYIVIYGTPGDPTTAAWVAMP